MFNKEIFFSEQKSNKSPILIIIRGPSSSGKSYLSYHLMQKINNYFQDKNSSIYLNPFILFSFEDTVLFKMMDPNFLTNGKYSQRGFSINRDKKGRIINFKGTNWALKLYKTHQDTLFNYIKENFNIICEGNFLTLNSLKEILKKIPSHYKVLIISLDPTLDLLHKRENNRKNRDIGFVDFQFDTYKKSLENKNFQHVIIINSHKTNVIDIGFNIFIKSLFKSDIFVKKVLEKIS